MGLLNKKYWPYILAAISFILFTVCLFIFKPTIKMVELYTLFARVKPETLQPIFDFGAENFILPLSVPAIPNIELANYPLIADIALCAGAVFLITLFSSLIPNIFIDFCLGITTVFAYCIFCITSSRTHGTWIPIVWPVLVQLFILFLETTAKAAMKQTKLIDTIKLFGYDINKYPNSIPFLKNIIRQPEKTEITLCCFKIRTPMYMDKTPPKDIVYSLNEIFKTVVDGILKHSGIIDKTSNNTIIGYWIGKDNAINAIKAIQEINSRVDSGNIRVSCGVDTEKTIFAILGSENFANYTLIGNITEIAARLENACIFHGTSLLISNNTLSHVNDKIIASHKGSISLHGVNSQLDFYEFVRFIDND